MQIFPSFVPDGASPTQAVGRDLEACAQADAAYAAVSLETHPKKKVRRASEFKVWGAPFLGDSGLLSMDCTKLVALSLFTARLARVGVFLGEAA